MKNTIAQVLLIIIIIFGLLRQHAFAVSTLFQASLWIYPLLLCLFLMTHAPYRKFILSYIFPTDFCTCLSHSHLQLNMLSNSIYSLPPRFYPSSSSLEGEKKKQPSTMAHTRSDKDAVTAFKTQIPSNSQTHLSLYPHCYFHSLGSNPPKNFDQQSCYTSYPSPTTHHNATQRSPSDTNTVLLPLL